MSEPEGTPPRSGVPEGTLADPGVGPKTSPAAGGTGRWLVIGLGNPLVSDDSVGLRVVELLKVALAEWPEVEVTEDYWGGLRLMERMIGYEGAIVIDAIRTGAPPGTIHRLTPGSIATQKSASAHDVSLPTALAFGRRAGVSLPHDEDVHLVGIEAEDLVNFSYECTPQVAAAIPQVVQAVIQMVHSLAGRRQNMISPEMLRRYPYFADVSEQALKEVAMISEEVTAATDTILFSEDDKAEFLYILTDGEIDLQYTLGSGELRTVDTAVPGDMVGWSALVEPYRLTAAGKVRKNARLIAIDGAKLRQLCEANHDLGYRLMVSITQLLATRLEGARVQLATVD